MNERSKIILLFIGGLVVGLLFGYVVVSVFSYLDKHGYNCEIGKPETIGDFTTDDSLFSQRYCAVEDCLQYNLYWNGSSECRV